MGLRRAGFFRVIPSFMVQFGLSGDPATSASWRSRTINDEPVKVSNKPGYITFAKTGAPNSRTTQLFINYGAASFPYAASHVPPRCTNARLAPAPSTSCHRATFSAVACLTCHTSVRITRSHGHGFVRHGLAVDNGRLDGMGFAPFGEVEGDGMTVVKSIFNCGEQPNQGQIQSEGNSYLDSKFPKLSKITSAKVLDGDTDL